MSIALLLLHTTRGAECCGHLVCLSVSLSVCLSVSEHICETAGLIAAQSSCGGVAISYVLLVLCMTSHVAVMGRMAMHCHTAHYSIAIPGQSLMSVNALLDMNCWLLCL